ncbi:MAG TPA: hypothetical protein VHC22_00850 [Pirellulales bacterium]|nr:hypothetical protein [Pirellulales bacterium]
MLLIALAALIASAVCTDFVAGMAVVALGAVFLLLRGSGDPGIFMFCLAYQWMFIVTGLIFQDLMGVYPGNIPTDSLGTAVALMLLSLVALAGGIRGGMILCDHLTGPLHVSMAAKEATYDVNRLFWLVISLFAASWLTNATSRQVAYSISQILSAGVQFRFVFLYMLFLTVIRSGRGWGRGLVALAFALIPTFTSGMSSFKELLFMLLLAMLTEIARRRATIGLSRGMKRTCLAAACLAMALVPVGLIWNGAIKPAWRPQVQGAQRIEGSRIALLGAFFNTAVDAITHMDWTSSVETSAQRFSNAPYLFSRVVDRIPGQIPYEDGSLTWRGVQHILTPRFLFPNKVNLGSDSWMVRKYAGVAAAGEESDTSVGLSYLAEFYIDFGPIGMCVAAFCFGSPLGMAYRSLALVAPSPPFYAGSAATVMIGGFMGLEAGFAKLLGTLVMNLAVFAVLLRIFGRRWHSALVLVPKQRRRPSAIGTRVVNKPS